MDIRVGDVVRLKHLTVSEIYWDGTFNFEGANDPQNGCGFVPEAFVEEIISRVENKDEKIARLERELAEVKDLYNRLAESLTKVKSPF